MEKVLIVAACKGSQAIGKDNDLLWHLPADMQFFKSTTSGYPILTGRKNYESIPERFRPLPNRENLVLTRDSAYEAPGAIVVNTMEEALLRGEKTGKEKLFVIGGGQIYKMMLEQDLIDTAYITWVEATLDADTFLEGFDQNKFEAEVVSSYEKDDKNPFNFTIVKYTRKLVA